jgi:hypothetical protein
MYLTVSMNEKLLKNLGIMGMVQSRVTLQMCVTDSSWAASATAR